MYVFFEGMFWSFFYLVLLTLLKESFLLTFIILIMNMNNEYIPVFIVTVQWVTENETMCNVYSIMARVSECWLA